MKKKTVVLIVGAAGAVYMLPKALDGMANISGKISNKLRKLSLYLKLLKVSIDLLEENPELQNDPRIVALNDEFSFLEIKENYNTD